MDIETGTIAQSTSGTGSAEPVALPVAESVSARIQVLSATVFAEDGSCREHNGKPTGKDHCKEEEMSPESVEEGKTVTVRDPAKEVLRGSVQSRMQVLSETVFADDSFAEHLRGDAKDCKSNAGNEVERVAVGIGISALPEQKPSPPRREPSTPGAFGCDCNGTREARQAPRASILGRISGDALSLDDSDNFSCLSACIVERTMVEAGIFDAIIIVNPDDDPKTRQRAALERKTQRFRRRFVVKGGLLCLIFSIVILVIIFST